ncbi:uncharacterized protein LOC144116186 [Amblyomma americanum]
MDEQLACFDPADLMFLFKTHKDCAACSSARIFFEPGTQRLRALQLTLGWTDRTAEIPKYLNSSSSDLELTDRIVKVLTDIKPKSAKSFKAFVAGTASRQLQKNMWQFLLELATVDVEPSIAKSGWAVGAGTDFSRSSTADLSKMSFMPVVASTPMLAAPAAPPSAVPQRKAAKCLFQGDECPGSEKVDTLDETGSAMKQMVSTCESCPGSPLTSGETSLAASIQDGKAAAHPSVAATLYQLESKLESLRQHFTATATIVEVEDRTPEQLASAAQFREVNYACSRLGVETQRLSAVLARPQADGQWRVTLTAQQAADLAAGATAIERALALIAVRKGLTNG